MNEEIKDNPKIVDPKEISSNKGEPETWVYGDLYMECKCGCKDLVAKNIKSFLPISIYNTSDSYLKLICPDCGHEMKLYTEKALTPPEEGEDEENIIKADANELQEDSKTN